MFSLVLCFWGSCIFWFCYCGSWNVFLKKKKLPHLMLCCSRFLKNILFSEFLVCIWFCSLYFIHCWPCQLGTNCSFVARNHEQTSFPSGFQPEGSVWAWVYEHLVLFGALMMAMQSNIYHSFTFISAVHLRKTQFSVILPHL